MHLQTRNVNTAFHDLVKIFLDPETGPGVCEYPSSYMSPSTVSRPSRNGSVLMINEPVLITYTHPRERVLFNPVRDANPFFHLYEALWMLAGCNDVGSVAYYASQMREYSDDGMTLNGAYGYRWRHAQDKVTSDNWVGKRYSHDQLDILVSHLRAEPGSRRAVLSMWNVEDDLLKIGSNVTSQPVIDLEATSKDVCCNLNVMFSIRPSPRIPGEEPEGYRRYLDMTVTNRSNDLVWGLLGANYVHFTFLQEYMAARLGVEVGKYHHFTNNLHAYVDRKDWNPEQWLTAERYDGTERQRNELYSEAFPGVAKFVPLISNPEAFEEELPLFVQDHNGPNWHSKYHPQLPYTSITEPFLRDVAYPMLVAYHWHKKIKAGAEDEGDIEDALSNIQADDWRMAATAWMNRRRKKTNARSI